MGGDRTGEAATGLLRAPDLDADALVDAFHRGALSPAGLDHRQHVRLAWACLRGRPLPRVLEGFRTGLGHVAAHAGQPDLYHETVTWTYLLLVAERLRRQGEEASWDDFAAANPDLVGPPAQLLGRYYRQDTLDSAAARRGFVFPDALPAQVEKPAGRGSAGGLVATA
jgi:hypothetical protein